jgi:protein-tyrosine phosphatase
MFNLFKKKSANTTVVNSLPITTDIHSHILPGIDDGSPNVETSLKLVKGMQALGIKKMIATPHVIADLYRNTPETISQSLNILASALAEEQIEMELKAAAEYMLDDYFVKLLRSGSRLLTLHKNIVLTEQSYATPTANVNEIAFELISSGYRPIMAHPERYAFYHNNYQAYAHLKDMGFLLQVNLLSLTGYYGKPVAKAARYLLENDLADLVGTDLHHERHLQLFNKPETLSVISTALAKRSFNDLSLF